MTSLTAALCGADLHDGRQASVRWWRWDRRAALGVAPATSCRVATSGQTYTRSHASESASARFPAPCAALRPRQPTSPQLRRLSDRPPPPLTATPSVQASRREGGGGTLPPLAGSGGPRPAGGRGAGVRGDGSNGSLRTRSSGSAHQCLMWTSRTTGAWLWQ